MIKTKFFLLILSLLIVSACSQDTSVDKKDQSEDSPGITNEKVVMTIGKSVDANVQLPEGETPEDNEYVRYLSEKLNVEYVHAWQATGDAYSQRVSLALSSGDIPDVMVVDKTQLDQMVRADLVEDLTDAFQNNVSDELLESYESTGSYSLDQVTYDGKMMAIPNINPGADAINVLWVRQDWLDTLGLEAPKTLDDVASIAKAFMESDPNQTGQDDTVGLMGNPDIVNVGNSSYSFGNIFHHSNSYPELWIENGAGEIVYGSVEPETKEALAVIRNLYQEGIIDKEFAMRNDSNLTELVVSGKAGIFFGPWWLPFSPLNDSVGQDSKAEWKAYLAPLDEQGQMNSHLMAPSTSYLVVKKGFSHPEKVIETLNYQFDMDQKQGEGYGFYEGQNVGFSWTNMPITLLLSRYDDKEKKALEVQKVIDGELEADSLMGESKLIYENYLTQLENPKKDLVSWSSANAFLTGALPLASDKVNGKQGVFYGQTKSMAQKWANLEKLEDEAFLQIILGNEPLDYFDEFVEQWHKMGGKEITEEVREIVSGN